MIRSAIVLTIMLALYWLALSGYFDHTILFVTGGISVLLVVFLCARMNILDDETVPYVHGKSIAYYAWLFAEIVKANFAVVKAVLSPNMEVSPALFKVPMDQSTDLGRTMFANSITLTPGTVSVALEDGEILVHALLSDMSNPDDFADMAVRAGWAVSDPVMTKRLIQQSEAE